MEPVEKGEIPIGAEYPGYAAACFRPLLAKHGHQYSQAFRVDAALTTRAGQIIGEHVAVPDLTQGRPEPLQIIPRVPEPNRVEDVAHGLEV